jgi:hypothetical protein
LVGCLLQGTDQEPLCDRVNDLAFKRNHDDPRRHWFLTANPCRHDSHENQRQRKTPKQNGNVEHTAPWRAARLSLYSTPITVVRRIQYSQPSPYAVTAICPPATDYRPVTTDFPSNTGANHESRHSPVLVPDRTWSFRAGRRMVNHERDPAPSLARNY